MTLPPENIIVHDSLNQAPDRIRHGFFTREGGVSQGIFASLNIGLGSSDNHDHVVENRTRIAKTMGVDDHNQFLAPFQIHSPDVWTVSKGDTLNNRIKADGIVTAIAGVPIGVATADCGPVLFADFKNQIIGAAHAGWKGAVGGVLENTISAMEALGANKSEIIAVLGPSISVKNYEVDGPYRENILSLDNSNAQWFLPSINDGHFMFDLQGYTLNRLKNAGIQYHSTGHCTYEDEKRFFSYRRTTHRSEPDYGRQVAAITLLAQ